MKTRSRRHRYERKVKQSMFNLMFKPGYKLVQVVGAVGEKESGYVSVPALAGMVSMGAGSDLVKENKDTNNMINDDMRRSATWN